MSTFAHSWLYLLSSGTCGSISSWQHGRAQSVWSIRQWAARWKEARHIFIDSACSVFAQGSREQFHRCHTSHATLHWLKLPSRFSLQDRSGSAQLASSDSPLLFTQRAATPTNLAIHMLQQTLALTGTMGSSHKMKGRLVNSVGSTAGSMIKVVTTEMVVVSKATSGKALEAHAKPAVLYTSGYVACFL